MGDRSRSLIITMPTDRAYPPCFTDHATALYVSFTLDDDECLASQPHVNYSHTKLLSPSYALTMTFTL